ITARAADPAGRMVAGELASRGVELAGPVLPGRTGVVVSLSDAGRSRSMLTDRGVGTQLQAAHLKDEWFTGCTRLHLPGYSLLREPVQGAAPAAPRRPPGPSVDLSSPSALRDYGVDRFRALLAGLRPQAVFGTEEEADLVGEVPGAEMVVKLGPRGVCAGGVTHAAAPVTAVDATGAGDAFAAGYLLGGVSLGLAAAARAVARMGAMPWQGASHGARAVSGSGPRDDARAGAGRGGRRRAPGRRSRGGAGDHAGLARFPRAAGPGGGAGRRGTGPRRGCRPGHDRRGGRRGPGRPDRGGPG